MKIKKPTKEKENVFQFCNGVLQFFVLLLFWLFIIQSFAICYKENWKQGGAVDKIKNGRVGIQKIIMCASKKVPLNYVILCDSLFI